MAKKRFNADEYDENLSSGGSAPDPLYDDLESLGQQSWEANQSSKGFSTTDRNIDEFTNYLGENIDPYGDNLEKQRAQSQSNWEQLGNGVARLGNVVPGVIGGLASAFDIPSYFDSSDTSNWLTDFTNEAQESLREATPIYKENPNEAFDMGDPAWWIEGGSDTVKSAAEFIVEGMVLGGVGKAIGSGLKAVRNLNKSKLYGNALAGIERGNSFKRIQDFAGASANAYALNHIETLMETNSVYHQTLEDNISLGKSYEDAKKLAGDAAAMTSKINKVNFLLNITSAGKLLKGNQLTRNILSKQTIGRTIGELGLESGQEAIEELVNHIGAEAGTAIGKGKEVGMAEVIEYLGQDQAWAAAFWGAIGGASQTGGTNLKGAIKKTDTEDGRVSERTAANNAYERQQAILSQYDNIAKSGDVKTATDVFNDLADQIVLNNQILEAQKAKDYDKVEKLNEASLVSQAHRAFENGTTGKLIELYKGLKNGPQQKDMSDDYKERADKAIATIERLENVYNRSKDYVNQRQVFLNRGYRENSLIQYDNIKSAIDSKTLAFNEQLERVGKRHGISSLESVAGQDRLSYDSSTLDLNPGKTTEQTSKYNEFLKEVKKLEEYSEIKNLESNLINIDNDVKKLDDIFNEIITPEYQAQKSIEAAEAQEEAEKNIEDAKREKAKEADKAERKEEKAKEKTDLKDAKETIEGNQSLSDKELKDLAKKFYQHQEDQSSVAKEAPQQSTTTTADLEKFVDGSATQGELDKIRKYADDLDMLTPDMADKIALKSQAIQKALDAREFAAQKTSETESTLNDVFNEDKAKDVDEASEKAVADVKKANAEASSDTNDEFDYSRTTDGYNKLAYLSRAFSQMVNDEGKVSREDLDNSLLEGNSKLLLSDSFDIGTPITIAVDDNAETEVYVPNSTEKEKTTWGALKSNLSESEIADYIPIVIKDSEGRNIAYLHSADWMKEENIKGSIEENLKNIRSIRKEIIDKGSISTTVSDKKPGSLISNKDGYQKVSDAFPDPNLKIFITVNGEMKGLKTPFKGSLINDVDSLLEGVAYTLLPTSNGESIATPISNEKMSGDMVHSIISAVEAFSSQEHNDLSEHLVNNSETDVRNVEGLRKYLKQFAYLFNVPDTYDSLEDYLKHEDVNSIYRLMTVTGNSIDFGAGGGMKTFSLSANTPEEARPAIMNRLKTHLEESFFNVNQTSINSSKAVEGLVNGEVDVLANSYNDLIKENTSTGLLSFNIGTEENPEYIYTIQPSIEFDDSFANKEVAAKKEAAPKSDVKAVDSKGNINYDALEFDFGQETFEDDEDIDFSDFDVFELPFTQDNKVALRSSVEHLFIHPKIPFGLQHSTIRGISAKMFIKILENDNKLSKEDTVTFFRQEKDNLERLRDEATGKKKALISLFVNNFENVATLTKRRLSKYSNIKIIEGETGQDLDFGESAGILEKKSFEDGSTTFLLNTKDTMSERLKMFMAGIPASNTHNLIGIENFMEFDEVSNEVMSLLAGRKPDFNDYVDVLSDTEIHAAKPWMKNFVDKLKTADDQVKTEFTVAMTKHHVKMNMVFWKVDGGKYTLSPADSNSGKVEDILLKEWKGNLFSMPYIKSNDEGDHIVDKEAFQSVEARFKSYKTAPPSQEVFTDLLSSIGLDLSEDVIDKMLTGKYKNKAGIVLTYKQLMTLPKASPLAMMVNTLSALSKKKKPLDTLSLPFKETEIKHLAKVNSKFITNKYSASHKAGEKTIWSFSNNKYANNRIQDLKRLNESTFNGEKVFTNTKLTQLNSLSFNGTHNDLMRMALLDDAGEPMIADNGEIVIDKNSKMYKFYEVSYLSLETLKKLKSKAKGSGKLTENSPMEHEVVKLGLFANRGASDKEGNRRVKMFYPTMSDKSTMLLLETLAQDIGVDENGSISDSSVRTVYEQMALPELNRIRSFENIKENGKSVDVKGYKDGANKFLIFPELNNDPSIMLDGKLVITPNNPEPIIAYLKDFLNNVISEQIEDWRNLGIVNDKGVLTFVDSQYKKKFKKHGLKNIAADYAINYMLHNASVFKNYTGDPALFYKSKSDDSVQQSMDTFINMGKRLAGDLAPGYESDLKGTYKVAFIKDPESVSNNIKFYTKTLDGEEITDAEIESYKNGSKGIKGQIKAKYPKSSPYFDIEGADAQEFVSWKEHLKVLKGIGKISEKKLQQLTKKLEKNESLDSRELDVVFQPLKPVHVSNKFEKHNDLDRRIYIKSSAFPLLPQLTGGLEIDKMRKKMEEQGVDKVVFYTATKVGAPSNSVEAYEKDGTLKNDISFDNAIDLSYDGWRIQQDVPYKEDKDKINVGTQERKLLFSNIKGIGGFSYNGKKYTGEKLEAVYNSLYEEIYEDSYNQLIEDLEWNGKDLNRQKLGEMLIQEAIERDYPLNDQLALEIVDGDFKVPLWALTSTEKVESLLTSIVNNKIIKKKHHGKSYVLGSEEGFRNVKSFEESAGALSEYKNKIVWTSSFNNELLPHKFTSSTFRPSQVLVPTIMKDRNGKVINVQDYATEVDGKLMLDETKIPKELLQLFGFRIPTQGHNSMMMMEIVGFLPKEMGDLLIASRDLTIQMGSDFDVDKLYTYQYNIFQDTDGTFLDVRKLTDENIRMIYDNHVDDDPASTKLLEAMFGEDAIPENWRKLKSEFKEKQTQNSILDIHNAVMSNPDTEMQSLMAKPIDFGDLDGAEGLANTIANQRSARLEGSKLFNPTSATYQRQKYVNASAGKAGVGALSLDSVFHATAQNKGLFVRGTKKNPFEMRFGLQKSTGVISNAKTLDGKKYISDVIAAYQSAAVDNEKEQILDKLNINGYTFGTIKALALLGFDESTISAVISQDVIFELANRLTVNDSALASERLTKEDIMRNMLDEIDGEVDPALADRSTSNLLEYVEKGEAIADYKSTQKAILAKFIKLDELGDTITEIQLAINSDSSGVGKSMFALNKKVDGVIDLYGHKSIGGADNLIGDYVLPKDMEDDNPQESGYQRVGPYWIRPTTINGFASVRGAALGNEIFSKLFPYDSPVVREAISEYKEITGKKAITEKIFKKIFNGLKSYLYTDSFEHTFDAYLPQKRDELLMDRKDDKGVITKQSLASVIDKLKKQPGMDKHPFIGRLNTEINFNGQPSLVTFDAAKGEDFDEESIYMSVIDMFAGNKNYPSIDRTSNELIGDLMVYSMMNGGIQQAKEFVKYIPVEVFNQLGFSEMLRDIDFRDTAGYRITNGFMTQYFQNNSFEIETVDSKSLDFGGVPINKAYELTYNSELDLTPTYIRVEQQAGDLLFKFNGSTWEKIPTLGTTDISEYDMSEVNLLSVIEKNNENTINGVNEIAVPKKDSVVDNSDKFYEIDGLDISGKEKITRLLEQVDVNPEYKDLVDVVTKSLPEDISFSIESDLEAQGATRRSTNTGKIEIAINPTTGDLSKTLLHEALHAVTVAVIKEKKGKAYNNIKALHSLFVKKMESRYSESELNDLMYNDTWQRAALNIEEFVAISMTDSKFQSFMKTEIWNDKKTFFDKLTEVFKSILVALGVKKGVDLNPIVLKEVISLVNDNTALTRKPIGAGLGQVNTTGVNPKVLSKVKKSNPFGTFVDPDSIGESAPQDVFSDNERPLSFDDFKNKLEKKDCK